MTTRLVPPKPHRHDILCWVIGWCPQSKKKAPQKVHTSGRKR
jgi:hypothetical protein